MIFFRVAECNSAKRSLKVDYIDQMTALIVITTYNNIETND
jgi:hypothetical protein